MHTKTFWAALALSLAASGALAHGETHSHQALHGGVVVEAGDLDFELVARADAVALYVRDHGKPAKLEGASAKLTLLSGKDRSEVQLAPAGGRLEAKGSFALAAGSKAVATVQLVGKKPVNVRFALK